MENGKWGIPKAKPKQLPITDASAWDSSGCLAYDSFILLIHQIKNVMLQHLNTLMQQHPEARGGWMDQGSLISAISERRPSLSSLSSSYRYSICSCIWIWICRPKLQLAFCFCTAWFAFLFYFRHSSPNELPRRRARWMQKSGTLKKNMRKTY